MRSLMEWDGAKVEGQILTINRAQCSISGDELFAFVRTLLEQEVELNNLRRSYGGRNPPVSPRVTVKVVQDGSRSPQTNAQQKEKNW